MHGEFKVPGGKLVVVDLDVVEGRLANVRVAGDFFLEPDDALEDINAAISGLPAESDAATISKAVTAALPDGALLLGFSAEAVATTVRRALQNATGHTGRPPYFAAEPALARWPRLVLMRAMSRRT